MGKFHDTLGGLDDFPDLNLPDGFGEGITGAYDADLADATGSASAKIVDLEGQVAQLTADLQAQKLINYDLVMSMPSEPVEGDEGNPDGLPNPAESDAELPDSGVASLFEEVDDDGNPIKTEKDD